MVRNRIGIFLVVTLICISVDGQNVEENSVTVPGVPSTEENSRFEKFLSLFGIGSSKQFPSNDGQRVPEFVPYRYPCAVSVAQTTTTPSPLVMNPLLCPFPPMMPPANFQPPNGEISHLPVPQQPGWDQFAPPPPHHGGFDPSGMRPPPPQFPSFHPDHQMNPSGLPPPIMIPLQPGQRPPPHYPGDHQQPPYPGQNGPHPNPSHNFPPQIQPGGTPNNPYVPILIPGQFKPNGEGQLPSIHHPERPVPVESGPEPVRVQPVLSNPLEPVRVRPTVVDLPKPLHVSPVDIQTSQPLVVDPTHIHTETPLVVDPLRQPPTFHGDTYPPPDFSDPKAFSRYPAISPFGPTNVLINPGFPDPPPTPPPVPSTPPPTRPPTILQPVKNISYARPFTVLINPGLPFDPPPQHLLNLPHSGLVGRPNGPFNPNDAAHPPENIHLIPLMPLPSHLQPAGNPLHPVQGDKLNQTLPGPPSTPSLPPPPPLYDVSGNKPISDSIVAPVAADGLPQPSGGYPPVSNLALPEQPRPPCGSPFLKAYVPHGFHLSSVNQFIGMPPVPNQRLNFPCPTLDLLQSLDFNIMRSLIVSSGLLPLFDHTKNYTLFIPSDASFRRLPRWFRDSLDVDKKLKKALILNHLIKEDVPLSVLENEELILSARPGGNRLRVNVYESSNTYRTITVDGAEVEKGDILTSTGRIHILNKVLMPNLPRNAAQFLSEKLEFESFWNLVKQAGLVESFQDPRPFTLFLPTNEAIQRLSSESSFLSDTEKVKNFINYHVVNGTYYSNGLIDNEFLLTNYEKEIKMQVTGDTHSKSLRGINGRVKVIKSDISLTNGVAHVIDQCISDETPFYVYPQSDEFKNEFGVLRRSFKVSGEEKNIEQSF